MAAQTEGTTPSPSSGSYIQNNVSDAEYANSEQLGKDLEKFSESIVTGEIDAVDCRRDWLRNVHRCSGIATPLRGQLFFL